MMQFVPIIERAPFQVYGAALAFCPNKSTVRKTFHGRVLPFAKKIRAAHDDWSPILQILEGHKYDVNSVTFSKDGKLIASTSNHGGEVYLWETKTGGLKRILRAENGDLTNTSFSPRGQLIASGRGSMIWVWDEQTGVLVRSIHISLNPSAIACSLDGDILATANVY